MPRRKYTPAERRAWIGKQIEAGMGRPELFAAALRRFDVSETVIRRDVMAEALRFGGQRDALLEYEPTRIVEDLRGIIEDMKSQQDTAYCKACGEEATCPECNRPVRVDSVKARAVAVRALKEQRELIGFLDMRAWSDKLTEQEHALRKARAELAMAQAELAKKEASLAGKKDELAEDLRIKGMGAIQALDVDKANVLARAALLGNVEVSAVFQLQSRTASTAASPETQEVEEQDDGE